MAGGLGRAQGGYDEMVFRAKVHDHLKLFSPLGLESEGTQTDFQVGANSYLYGTRFFSYLALTYGVEKTMDWLRRSEDSKGFYSSQFKHVFGKSLDSAWADWIAFEHKFQEAESRPPRPISAERAQHLSPRGLGSMSRGFIDEKTNSLIAAFRYPGRIGFLGRMDLATGKLTHLTDFNGMMLYKVTSVAFDPDSRTAFYTDRELRLSRPQRDRRRHRQEAPAADRRAHRRPRVRPRRQEPVGHPPPERLRHAGPDPAALHQLQPDQDLPLRRDPVRPRRLARRRADLGLLRHRRRQAVGQGLEARRPRAGQFRQSRRDAVAAALRCRRISPSRPTARRCSATAITPASRTSSGSTSPAANMTS